MKARPPGGGGKNHHAGQQKQNANCQEAPGAKELPRHVLELFFQNRPEFFKMALRTSSPYDGIESAALQLRSEIGDPTPSRCYFTIASGNLNERGSAGLYRLRKNAVFFRYILPWG